MRRQPRELLRDGKHVPLQDLPLQILEVLVARPGEIVTREQLIARLWPKRVVDYDTALNTAVRRLRAALGDHPEAPGFVETIPRIGYRFIGAIEAPDRSPDHATAVVQSPEHPRQRNRRIVAAAVALLLLALAALVASYWRSEKMVESPDVSGVRSIAVLPFSDLSPEQDQQHFSDGLAEDILNLLAQSPQLRVTARTSSFSLRDKDIDIAAVAAKLNVSFVLEGSVRKVGDRVRITTQLIDATTSSHLWSQSYDRTLSDIFEVQSDVAASVARALEVALAKQGEPHAHSEPQAYERFLQAQYFLERRAAGDLERAKRYFQESLDFDAGFARAWAGLASAFWIQVVTGEVPRDSGLESVRDAAERALAIDPNIAEAHIRMALYSRAGGDATRGEEHMRRAAAVDPSNSLVLGFAASTAMGAGRLDEAIALQRRVAAQDPLSTAARSNLGSFLYFAGRYTEAQSELQKARELRPNEPTDMLCLTMVLNRQFVDALEIAERWPQGRDSAQCRALAFHGLNRKAEADAAIKTLIGASQNEDPLRIAEVHAYRGEWDPAFRWLEAAANKHRRDAAMWPPPATHDPQSMRFSPFLAPLQTDPRWKAWVANRDVRVAK